MKIKYPHKFSATFISRCASGFVAAILYMVFQLCPSAGKSQTAYWLESIKPGVKKQDVVFPPVPAANATVLSTPGIPMFIFEDDRNGFVYWSDAATGSIKRISTAGGTATNVITNITGSGIYPRGIYVDVTHNELYWAETAPGVADVIKKASIAGTLPRGSSSGTVVVSGIDVVRGITVDTAAFRVYFVDAGTHGSGQGIYRAPLSTSITEAASVKVAAAAAGTQPNSLCIDDTHKFIYWSNFSQAGQILRAATNAVSFPASQTIVATGNSIRGISIDPGANTIYWTEYPSLVIRTASLSTIPIVDTTIAVSGLPGFPRNVMVPSSLNAPPAINSFTPSTAGTTETVTIKGKHFTGSTAVSFGGVAAASFTVVNDSVITAVVAAGASGNISVTNPHGTGIKAGFVFCTAVTPSVSITSDTPSPICAGIKVTFSATAINGGTPVYQWHKNNTIVGGNTKNYADNLLNNNDSVWCVITSTASCATTNTAKSNVMHYVVNPKLSPTLKVTINTTTSICTGTSVTFTATANNSGANPQYQWEKNNINVGTNSATYTDAGLNDKDSVICVLTITAPCATPTNITSGKLKFTVASTAPAQPSTIKGLDTVYPGETYLSYAVTVVAGDTYNWTVPADVNIVSGQGTYKLIVNWGTTSGVISVTAVNGCGVSTPRQLSVSASGVSFAGYDPKKALLSGGYLRVYPNPVTSMATIQFNAATINKYEAQVINSLGQSIMSKSGVTIPGLNTLTLDMSKFASTIYYVRLIDKEHGVRIIKLVKAE